MRWLPFEIHPDTPPEGAPKPFSPEEWPQVRDRLKCLDQEVGLPIHPPQHNMNSRFALETAELVRAQKGDSEAGTFCHHVSRAFFTEHADISQRELIVPIAERFGISASDVETAWHEHRFSPTVDAFSILEQSGTTCQLVQHQCSTFTQSESGPDQDVGLGQNRL